MVYNHVAALTGTCWNFIALVAQLDRVLASEAKGRGFDSRRARHFPDSVDKFARLITTFATAPIEVVSSAKRRFTTYERLYEPEFGILVIDNGCWPDDVTTGVTGENI